MLNRHLKIIVFLPLWYALLLKQNSANAEWLNTNVSSAIKYDIANILNVFIHNEERRLNNVMKSVQILNFAKKNWLITNEYRETFVGHPVNSYSLIKKLTYDWNQVKNTMDKNCYDGDIKVKTNEIESNLSHLREVLNSTMYTVGKLQEMYNLTAKDIAVGKWGNLKLNFDLTYEACARIGKYFHSNVNYDLALQWLEVSLEMSKNETIDAELVYLASKFKILEGEIRGAFKHFARLRYYDYSDEKNQAFIDHIVEMEKNMKPFTWGGRLHPKIVKCRNACRKMLNLGLNSNFRCRYNRENSPFLKLAPLKEEIISHEPFIRIFRDIIHEDEIQLIKHETKNRMIPASTFRTADLTHTNYKIRQAGVWTLKKYSHKLLRNVMKRIEDMTTFKTESGEDLQAVHYGVGGHYVAHEDALHPEYKLLHLKGNRIATVLFYLNDVELGGGTAFTNLGLVIEPIKGSALVWHNLLPDGRGNALTQHCACPVLAGQKWVMTEWLRELGQTANCSLQ